MPKLELQVLAVRTTLEDGPVLGELVGFPELSSLALDPERLSARLRRLGTRLVEHTPPLALHRRLAAGVPQVVELDLELEPPRKQVLFLQPLTLHLQLIRWAHGETAHLAYIPALGIQVVSPRADELPALARKQAREALLRRKAAASLAELVALQRTRAVEVETLQLSVELKSPKQRAAQRKQREKPVLAEIGRDLTQEALDPAHELEPLVARLAEALSGRRPRSVLLVGDSGVGKSALVRELARRRGEHGLARTPFWATSGSRIVAGMCGFGAWQARCQRLRREAKQAGAVLWVGNLVELMEVGKSEWNAQGVAAFLRPAFSRGELLGIAECTPEQLSLIEREGPHLLEAFLRIDVPAPTPAQARAIITHQALIDCERLQVDLDEEGLDLLDRLHRRYATYSAFPGRPLRFLRGLLTDLPRGSSAGAPEVLAAFAQETGLPRFLLDEEAVLDLEATRARFAARVMGQAAAVTLVVDLLATVKSLLSRPRQPIASLLFVGPTGVGKTEMAKALAAFLFGDEARLTRLDMSEYQDPLAVERLIGGWGPAGEGVLTARVREQPFSVVLLDELEKAHPLFFDLLLQVLGEGRLTDARGRVADFSNAVVVMTSNLGARGFQQGGLGFGGDDPGQGDAEAHFLEAVRAFLRPELFNRLDRVVPFGPLDARTVAAVARRELEKLERRNGIRYRGVRFDVGEGVADELARRGFDPRYGARPLKRCLERELVAPLADALNGYVDDVQLEARVRLREGEDAADGKSLLRVKVRPRLDEAGGVLRGASDDEAAVELAEQAATLRRKLQRLERSSVVLGLRNELYRLERLERRLAKRPKQWERMGGLLAELPRVRGIAELLDAFSAVVYQLEEDTLFHLHAGPQSGATFDTPAGAAQLERANEDWKELLLELYALRFEQTHRVALGFYAEDPAWLARLTQAYQRLARSLGLRWELREVGHYRCAACGASPPVDLEKQVVCQGCDALHCLGCFQQVGSCRRCARGEALTLEARAQQLPAGGRPAFRAWRRRLREAKVTLRRVPDAGPFFARLPRAEDKPLGLLLSLEGKLVVPRFVREGGSHQLRGSEGTDACFVHVSEEFPHYLPPEGVRRKGGLPLLPRRRSYEVSAGRVLDLELQRPARWDGQAIGPVLRHCLETSLIREVERRVLPPRPQREEESA